MTSMTQIALQTATTDKRIMLLFKFGK